MTDFASSLTRTIARDYDLFQASLEFLQKERKFLNYGYTVSGKGPTRSVRSGSASRCSRRPRLVKGTSSSTSASAAESTIPPVEHVRVQPPGWLQHLRTAGSLCQRAGHPGERGSQAFVSPGRSRAASRRRRLIRGQDPGDRVRVLLRSAALLPASGLGMVLADIAFADPSTLDVFSFRHVISLGGQLWKAVL